MCKDLITQYEFWYCSYDDGGCVPTTQYELSCLAVKSFKREMPFIAKLPAWAGQAVPGFGYKIDEPGLKTKFLKISEIL